MKKKVLFFLGGLLIVALMTFNSKFVGRVEGVNVTLSAIMGAALASGENGGYSCSATAKCFDRSRGNIETGSVSCTGTKECSSGYEFVKCDGIESRCS